MKWVQLCIFWTFFGISFLWNSNENWPFPVLDNFFNLPKDFFFFKWAKEISLGHLIFLFRSSDPGYAIYSPNETLLYLHCLFCYYYVFILVSAVTDDRILSVTDHIMLNIFSDLVVIKYFLSEDFWNFQMVWDLSFCGIH